MTRTNRRVSFACLVGLLWSLPQLGLAQQDLGSLVTLDSPRATVRQLLQQLETEKQFRLAYSESHLDVGKRVRLPNTSPSIKEILDAIGQATNTTYQVRGNQIIFRKKETKHTVSGYIRDATSGEDLIGANVWDGRTGLGTSSNRYGFYSLTLPNDTLRLHCSYVGHATQQVSFVLNQDTTLGWNLTDEMLAEVMIASTTSPPPEQATFGLPVAPARLLATPTLLGEVDLLKGLQRLPGVQSGSDGSASLYVRGSSPDQNLLLLDGVPVYNATHLFGFFSVFNADAVNRVEFFKGSFPARYGGRLASVVDIQLKEGNREKLQGTGSIGFLSTRLTLEGPVVNDKTSFLVSGRYGHPGPITRLIKALGSADRLVYSFYDLTAKLNHAFSQQDQVYLSAYLGRDRLSSEYQYTGATIFDGQRAETARDKFRWGNLTTAFRWNHVFSRRLFSNLTLTYSRYRFRLSETAIISTQSAGNSSTTNRTDKQRRSEIYDRAAKLDFNYFPSPGHHLRFGGSLIHHTFQPNTIDLLYQTNEQTLVDTTYGAQNIRGTEGDVYVEDEITVGSALTAHVGVRLTGFWVDGATYVRGQPRLSLQYQPSSATTWQASYSRMAQFVHLLANPTINLPTDQWLPTTRRLPPESAYQWTLGYQRTINPTYSLQAEAYYKDLRNIVEYKQGGFELYEEVLDWENQIASGRGRAYGLELLAQRTTGRLTGWLGYTLSRSERRFDAINGGAWFPFRYDRRHEVDLGGVFHWKERVDVSWGWGFASGFAFTLPSVAFVEVVQANPFVNDDARTRVVFGSRNGQRSRATHRLDVSISFRKAKRWGERTWEFGLYNVYSRKKSVLYRLLPRVR